MGSRECDVHSSPEMLLCHDCHSLKCCFFNWGRLWFYEQFFVKFVYTNIQNANACVLQQYILICIVLMQMYVLQMMYLRNSKWESTTLGERWHFHYHSVNLWRLGSGMNEGLEYPHKSRCLASLSFSLSVWLCKRQNLF